MKKMLLLLGTLMILTAVFTGCAIDSQSKATHENTNNDSNLLDSYQKVSTASYEVSIPRDWKFDTQPGNAVSFTLNGKKIGGIEVVSYYSDQPLSSVMPNHSEVLKQEELKDFSTKVYKVKLKITPPAASSEKGEKEEIHYYFIAGEQAYDLYFNADMVIDANTMLIAKSVKLNIEQKAKEQGTNETKTDSGRYQGQADSNFIEIKISGVPDENAAKVFMLSDEVKEKFDQLKLKKNDEIKFNYIQNENEQLVIIEMSKM